MHPDGAAAHNIEGGNRAFHNGVFLLLQGEHTLVGVGNLHLKPLGGVPIPAGKPVHQVRAIGGAQVGDNKLARRRVVGDGAVPPADAGGALRIPSPNGPITGRCSDPVDGCGRGPA